MRRARLRALRARASPSGRATHRSRRRRAAHDRCATRRPSPTTSNLRCRRAGSRPAPAAGRTPRASCPLPWRRGCATTSTMPSAQEPIRHPRRSPTPRRGSRTARGRLPTARAQRPSPRRALRRPRPFSATEPRGPSWRAHRRDRARRELRPSCSARARRVRKATRRRCSRSPCARTVGTSRRPCGTPRSATRRSKQPRTASRRRGARRRRSRRRPATASRLRARVHGPSARARDARRRRHPPAAR